MKMLKALYISSITGSPVNVRTQEQAEVLVNVANKLKIDIPKPNVLGTKNCGKCGQMIIIDDIKEGL